MADAGPENVALNALHEDLKGGFADLKAALIAGFRSLPSRESNEEMVRLLRERNQYLLSCLVRGRGDGSPPS